MMPTPSALPVEPLEARIAPATFVSSTTVTFQDVDGDDVTLKLSKPLFDVATLEALLKFNTGGANDGVATQQQLQLIDLTALTTPADADGLSITVTAKRNATKGGDGFVNVGAIQATGIDLGTVKIVGDLAQIDAGNGDAQKPALATLDVRSMGEFGLSTQGAGTGLLISNLAGSLGVLKVAGNLREVAIDLTGVGAGIKSITLGGSLLGGLDPLTGRFEVPGDIGKLTIKGGIFGNDGPGSGRILAGGKIGAATVLGSIEGGDGDDSGQIAAGSIGAVRIGGDLRGGVGNHSGVLDGGLALGSVTVRSMIGGGGDESGSILAELFEGSIASVKVLGDIRGGGGEESAYIHADKFIGPITIGGSLVGGGGDLSAALYAGNAITTQSTMTSVTIVGDVRGGGGQFAGTIGNAGGILGGLLALDIGKITIKGSVLGGGGFGSASIHANDIGSVAIGGSLVGSAVGETASIFSTGAITKATIGGSLQGGDGLSSGSFGAETLGTLKIGGNVEGGVGDLSAEIFVNQGGVKSITIGGSIISGTGEFSAGIALNSAVGSIVIGGSVIGTADDPVRVQVRGQDGAAKPLALGKLTIKGSATFLDVLAGYLVGTVQNADASIGAISVGGDWTSGSIAAGVEANGEGGFGTADDALGAAGNLPNLTATIASITIKGALRGTVGGTDNFGFVAEQIGKLKIGATTYGFTAAEDQIFVLGATLDFFAREDV